MSDNSLSKILYWDGKAKSFVLECSSERLRLLPNSLAIGMYWILFFGKLPNMVGVCSNLCLEA
jgi:hypothetical protein